MKIGDKIAVYGTLRPGFVAGKKMEQGARHLGKSLISGAKIYELGWFPGLKLSEDTDDKVTVDVFEIVDEQLPPRLDNYEGYPNLYGRQQVQTDDGDTVWVYTFNGQVKEQDRVVSGDWAESERSAGRSYA